MRMTPEEFLARFPGHATAQEIRSETRSNRQASSRRTRASSAGESTLEAIFSQQIRALRLPEPAREYAFHLARRWRADFAWPELKLIVEIEGGVWGMGRHNRPRGFIADTEKYNAAAQLGWTVLRFTGASIRSGEAISQVQLVVSDREANRLQQQDQADHSHDTFRRRSSRVAP